jgi:CheY-like chemotaxis protein
MNKKILIVEDEKLIRDLYEIAFTQRGYLVDLAQDGQVALDKLLIQDPQYDMILLDVMMPKVDGISVLKQIKQQDRASSKIPVFLLTNLGMDPIIKEALVIGAEQFIIKSNFLPFQIVDEIDMFFKNKEQPQG